MGIRKRPHGRSISEGAVPGSVSVEGALVSLAAGIVSASFAALVLGNYFERRKPHNLMWGLALLMFTLVMFVQVGAEWRGWSDGTFKAWYFLGTSLVAFLGAGSVYVVNRRLGHAFAGYVVILVVAFLAIIGTASTSVEALAAATPGRPPGGEAWLDPALPRRITPLLTIPGTVALIGIALLGLVRHRLTYNAWIAGGASVLAVGTGLPRFGVDLPFQIYVAEFAGIAIMFFGFLKAIEWAAKERAKGPVRAPVPAADEGAPAPVTEPK